MLSLLNLVRTLPLFVLPDLFQRLSKRIPWNVLAHLYTIVIEDVAGVRTAKSEERRLARKKRKPDPETLSAGVEEGDFQADFGVFPPPTVTYTCQILAAPVKGDRKGDRTKLGAVAKWSLLSIMMARTAITDPTWQMALERQEDGWKERVKASFEISGVVEEEEARLIAAMKKIVAVFFMML